MEIEDHLQYYQVWIDELRDNLTGLKWVLFRFGIYPTWNRALRTIRKMEKGINDLERIRNEEIGRSL